VDSETGLIAGEPGELAAFEQRHGAFIDGLGVLEDAFNAVFSRDFKTDSLDAVIFYLGRRCVDDFLEILLLCANGYSQGASALLRGLYERAVTAAYLHANPDEARDFIEYDIVRRRKLARVVESMPDAPPELTDGIDELEAQYRAVQERFMVTDCRRCGTQRLNHTWTRLDFATMAARSGHLSGLILPAYYMPLGHAHSTLSSITARLKERSGALWRTSEPNREEADLVLQTAHGVILLVLATQLDHFGDEGRASAANAAVSAFYVAWGVEPTGLTSASA